MHQNFSDFYKDMKQSIEYYEMGYYDIEFKYGDYTMIAILENEHVTFTIDDNTIYRIHAEEFLENDMSQIEKWLNEGFYYNH